MTRTTRSESKSRSRDARSILPDLPSFPRGAPVEPLREPAVGERQIVLASPVGRRFHAGQNDGDAASLRPLDDLCEVLRQYLHRQCTECVIPAKRDDENWMKHTLAWLDPQTGQTRIDYRPVHTYTLTQDVQYIAPKARTY